MWGKWKLAKEVMLLKPDHEILIGSYERKAEGSAGDPWPTSTQPLSAPRPSEGAHLVPCSHPFLGLGLAPAGAPPPRAGTRARRPRPGRPLSATRGGRRERGGQAWRLCPKLGRAALLARAAAGGRPHWQRPAPSSSSLLFPSPPLGGFQPSSFVRAGEFFIFLKI